MRLPLYDATADSLNSQFEQWVDDDLRSCINFNLSPGSTSLSKKERIAPDKNWSIEAWVCLPLAESDDQGGDRHPAYWRSLASSEDGQDGYLVTRYEPQSDTELLGIRVGGHFKSCGCDLTHLDDGWHHMSVTANNGATRFYIDGSLVGAYPELVKLEALKELEETSKPGSVKLADLREQLKLEKTAAHLDTKTDSQHHDDLVKQIAELEKNRPCPVRQMLLLQPEKRLKHNNHNSQ